MSESPIDSAGASAESTKAPLYLPQHLYHITTPGGWGRIRDNGRIDATQDLTRTWGAFMIDGKNFITQWKDEQSRLLRSIRDPLDKGLVLLQVSMDRSLEEKTKVRRIIKLRQAIRALIEQGAIDGSFYTPLPENLMWGAVSWQDIHGEEVGQEVPVWMVREPLEFFNWDHIPVDRVVESGSFQDSYELVRILSSLA